MIINKNNLLVAAPIQDMLSEKVSHNGVSHGLSEAGYDIRIKQTIKFYNNIINRFVLASSIEKFQMPSNLVGIVHDKSTWARKGLSVFNTVIEPGWHGYLTIELVYHGNGNLIIPAGSGIAQVIFHETSCNANYAGKYQFQADKPVEAIDSI